MTPERFAAYLNAVAPIYAYPLVGLEGSADNFDAYDAERQITLKGLFSTALTQESIDNARRLADGANVASDLANDMEADTVGCVVVPYPALLQAALDYDGGGLFGVGDVMIYAIVQTPDDSLAFVAWEDVY